MKNQTILSILIVLSIASCSPTRKVQFYNKYKSEIAKEIFLDFENYLPLKYEESLMARIRYAPSYNALGCSGIDVLYNLDITRFTKNTQKLRKENMINFNPINDTSTLNYSHLEYLSFFYNNQKIAIPRFNDDFCREKDTCFQWDDLETIILQYGTKKVFSNMIDPEYQPKNPNCNYSIGAYISKKEQHLIYWLLIYD